MCERGKGEERSVLERGGRGEECVREERSVEVRVNGRKKGEEKD